jgi:hypothetical protein
LLLAPAALVASLLAALLIGLASAAVADAATISYIGSDGNVHLVSPDGARAKQLTTDATADNKYRSPTQTDSGRTVAIRRTSGNGMAIFLDRDGNQVDAWNLPASGLGLKFAPFSGGQIAPEGNGGTMVYDYFHADGPPNYYSQVRVGFVAGGGLTNPCTINCHGGYLRPRWIPSSPYAAFLDSGFGRISVQRPGGVQTWIQVNTQPQRTVDIESFDLARPGGRVVLEMTPNGSPPEGQRELSDFEFYGFTGSPTELPQVGFVCVAQDVAPAVSTPRYSPDGSMIAWTGRDGVYVAHAPVHGPGGICNLDAKLVAPGGSQPDWGTVDLPAPPDGGGGGDGGGGIDPVDPTDPPKVNEAFKKGLGVELNCAEACTAQVKASVSKRIARRYGLGTKPTVVATGSGETTAPGPVEVELAFKAKAKRKLARARTLKLALEAKLAYASGKSQTLTDTLVLRR